MKNLPKTPFLNDPFAAIWTAFKKISPQTACNVYWVPEIEDEETHETAYGFTHFAESGEVTVCISANLKIEDAAEILAHELAHVVAGEEHEHDEVWEKYFESIQHGYYENIESKQNDNQ